MPGAYGIDGYGTSPYGSMPLDTSFRVIDPGTSETPYTVLVAFSFPINISFPPFSDPTNYSIPGLTVTAAAIENANTVRLTTSQQSAILYTVTVAQGQSAGGDPLDVLYRFADFLGIPSIPAYLPVGVRKSDIRLVFTEEMLLNAAILDINSYLVTDIHGKPINVLSVRSEQGAANPLAVVLNIDTEMQAAEWYVVTVSQEVVSAASGLSLVPTVQKMQWVEPTLNSIIAIAKFSGEVKSGLLADHQGLVYFSPALDAAVSGSIIQIDSVSVCTKAYDEYTLPKPPDPPAFFTYSSSSAAVGYLNSDTVLWGGFPRLSEAKFDFEVRPTDAMPAPVDSRAIATFAEQWDISYVALLNNSSWALYDGLTSLVPPTFICANNLGPIPPGPTTIVVLQP